MCKYVTIVLVTSALLVIPTYALSLLAPFVSVNKDSDVSRQEAIDLLKRTTGMGFS